jgi:hypothetical protein
VTEIIPQVADGIESLAVHPQGHMAVIACLEDLPWTAASAFSHLAVIDLMSRPASPTFARRENRFLPIRDLRGLEGSGRPHKIVVHPDAAMSLA